MALFEATHGTAPKYAGQDKVSPGSLILSAEMMLRHLGWNEAADLIITGMNGAIQAKTVTYDFERLMDGATLVSCSAFIDGRCTHVIHRRLLKPAECGLFYAWPAREQKSSRDKKSDERP